MAANPMFEPERRVLDLQCVGAYYITPLRNYPRKDVEQRRATFSATDLEAFLFPVKEIDYGLWKRDFFLSFYSFVP